ncbi:MAG: decaprenyl-phosphate phosphoribosyltransferase [Polyangiaceae bacterium]
MGEASMERIEVTAEAADGERDPASTSAAHDPHSTLEEPSAGAMENDETHQGFVWRLGGVIKTLRPHQWVKNAFVVAPVVFAREIFDPGLLTRAASAFGVFCLLAGAVYTMNDVVDVKADRVHPVKRYRPIPSGRVPLPLAKTLAGVLVVLALGSALLLNVGFFAVAALYFLQNLAYSFKLKKVPYLDVSLIALGFVLRVEAGGFATHISVSRYLIACTALLALFLGFGKRRHELAAAAADLGKTRASLERYTTGGLDTALVVTAVATIGVYLAYTLDPSTRAFFRTDYLWPTTAFVVAGVLRFLQLVRTRPKAESPTQEMLRDGPFVGILLLWIGLVLWIVYNLRPGG